MEIKDSGSRKEFETGAVRDIQEGKGRMDLLPWYAIMDVSRHCERGAKKYGERNVDKGIPLHSLLDSGARHLAKAIAGENDEDHLVAAAWNLLWALQQRTTHPELDDMPTRTIGDPCEGCEYNNQPCGGSVCDHCSRLNDERYDAYQKGTR